MRSSRCHAARTASWGLLAAGLLALGLACAERPGMSRLAAAADAIPAAAERWLRPQVARMSGFGTVNLTIYWPVRRHTATIPDSTRTLVIKTTQGGSQLREDVVSRQDGVASTSVSFQVPAGNNYSLTAKAYRETAPLPEGAAPIAQGSVSGLNVLSSKRATADLELAPMDVPSITGLDFNAATVGQEIILTGTNLGMIGNATPTVLFKTLPATRVTPVDSTTLRAEVPNGATIGRLFVTNDGVMSQSQVLFYVLSGIALDAPREAWDTGGPSSRLVKFGNTLSIAASPSWLVESGGSLAQYAPLPGLVWASSNPLGGTVDEGGTFTAGRQNVATDVSATIGKAVAALRVTPVGVTSVVLDKTALTLNAMPGGSLAAEGQFTTWATLSATVQTSYPFNGGVTWESSDTNLVTVDEIGKVEAVRDAPKGTAVVTATSVDEPTIKATAGVTVTILGDLALEVD